MVADDDPSILEVLGMVLEDEGYDVLKAVDGEVIYKMDKNYPDLVLLDIWMSGMDGRDICRFIKNQPHLKHIPVVMVSANKDTQSMAQEAGADGFLNKPFELDDFLNLVKKYLPNPHPSE